MTDNIDQNQDAEAERALDARAVTEAQAAGGPNDVGPDGSTVESELAEARAEAAEMRDKYLRTHAEMDNFRKRMERSYAEQSRAQTKRLLSKLLGVKDNLERALQYGAASQQTGESIIEGVRLTLYQLDGLLEQEGVKSIEAEGREFDPRLDEAIQSIHDPNVNDQTVVQVVRRGYTYGDEVLRPAQVIVSVHQ